MDQPSKPTRTHHQASLRLIWRILIKTAGLFVLFNLVFALYPPAGLGRISAYNSLFPGRERLPFGENPQQAYNLSLYNLDAMFASHVLAGEPKPPDEFRIIFIGDSSVWGTLLRPEETLAGHTNSMGLQACDGRKIRAYNLGYPTISLAKDLLILNRVVQYEPDLIVWLVTLEAFPNDKQLSSPVVQKNPVEVASLLKRLGLGALAAELVSPPTDVLSKSLFGRRRELADVARLQMYGIMWAATGIDQVYPEKYTPAQIDLAADEGFHGLLPSSDLHAALAWEVLSAGVELAGSTPVLLMNEPILISPGENHAVRYNYFYPRWAYDVYRARLDETARNNGWAYLDAWDLVGYPQFTNSAIHLTPAGEDLLAEEIAGVIRPITCR